MGLEEYITDLAGLAIIILGLISLTESLLQVQIIGSRMPLTQGTMISLFAISFGAVLLTENATKAFEKIKSICIEKIAD